MIKLFKKMRQKREARIRRIVREELSNNKTTDMDANQLEEWFNTMMLRVIRNPELNY